MKCPNCGSKDIDFQEAGGQSICITCGTVVEESTIVSSIEFQENGDRSHVIGQYVAATSSKPFSSSSRLLGRHMDNRDARDASLYNARRIITQVSHTLRLSAIYTEKAFRLYQLALQRNFGVGRRQMHIAATCLYIICRQEKSPHLLIDFSDALQINVYILGKAFLQFIRLLNINLDVIDPSLYIHRYADKLLFGDKMSSIVTTSLRIITRLKKDWIVTGRRPDGVCAAALLISARAHEFSISQDTIAQLFRISQDTVRNRLLEFKATPSAQLNIQQFFSSNIDNIIEFDPPSYVRNYLKENGGKIDLMFDKEDFSEENPPLANDLVNDRVYQAQVDEGLTTDLEEDNVSLDKPTDSGPSKLLKIGDISVNVPIPILRHKKSWAGAESVSLHNVSETGDGTDLGEAQNNALVTRQADSAAAYNDIYSSIIQSNANFLKLSTEVEEQINEGSDSLHQAQIPRTNISVPRIVCINFDLTSIVCDQEDDIPPLTEEEEGLYIFSLEEQQKRGALFTLLYGEFLTERDRKRKLREIASAQHDSDHYTQTGRLRKKYSRDPVKLMNNQQNQKGESSTSEAVITTSKLSVKGASKKINYEALQGIFSKDGSFAHPQALSSSHSDYTDLWQLSAKDLKRPSSGKDINSDYGLDKERQKIRTAATAQTNSGDPSKSVPADIRQLSTVSGNISSQAVDADEEDEELLFEEDAYNDYTEEYY